MDQQMRHQAIKPPSHQTPKPCLSSRVCSAHQIPVRMAHATLAFSSIESDRVILSSGIFGTETGEVMRGEDQDGGGRNGAGQTDNGTPREPG